MKIVRSSKGSQQLMDIDKSFEANQMDITKGE